MNQETGRLVPYLAEMFRFQAWISLGKIANPMSQKVERNLDAAREAIDLLSELETKTQGNLSDDESTMLQGVLTDLRLNFVEEQKRPAVEETSADAKAEAETETEEKVEADAQPAEASETNPS